MFEFLVDSVPISLHSCLTLHTLCSANLFYCQALRTAIDNLQLEIDVLNRGFDAALAEYERSHDTFA
jgi:hypothetical protein